MFGSLLVLCDIRRCFHFYTWLFTLSTPTVIVLFYGSVLTQLLVLLQLFDKWMSEQGLLNPDVRSAFVTCGDWDLQTM